MKEGPIFDGIQPPEALAEMFPDTKIHQVKSIHLNSKEKITKGSFVMVGMFHMKPTAQENSLTNQNSISKVDTETCCLCSKDLANLPSVQKSFLCGNS